MQAVGANLTFVKALFWNLAKAEATVLEDVSAPAVHLELAHDINASSWIIASGQNGGQRHAYVLVPVNRMCPFDLDGDGSVGFAVMLLVLTMWGPCEEGVVCSGDGHYQQSCICPPHCPAVDPFGGTHMPQ